MKRIHENVEIDGESEGKGNAAAVKAMLETTEAEVSPTEKEEVSLKSEIGRNVLGNRQKQNDGEMKSQDG
jgi:hypothetical protein